MSGAAVGDWVSFYADDSAVVGCLPKADARRLCGVVIGVASAPAQEPGGIPDWTLTVRGRSGAVAVFGFVQRYTAVFSGRTAMRDAVADAASVPDAHQGQITPADQPCFEEEYGESDQNNSDQTATGGHSDAK